MTPKIAEVVKSAPRFTSGKRNVKAIRKKIVKATIVKMLRMSVGRVDSFQPERETEKERVKRANEQVADDAQRGTA